MASDSGTQLTAVWFLASFLWLSYSLQRHSLINQPRLSSFFLLLITGALAFLTSLFSKWLPGADGRFDSDAVLKTSPSSLPPRPRRFYVPCIIVLIVLRLEIVHSVLYDFQCSALGVEAFLPLLFAAYRFFSYRAPPVPTDELEDPWGNPLDDLKNWLLGSPLMLLLSAGFLSYGAYSAANMTTRSTYFCASFIDEGPSVAFFQWVGLFMDAAIIMLAWRVLSWARTTRGRLRTLGGIMLSTAVASCVPLLVSRLYQQQSIVSYQTFRGIGSLYIFDTLSTGIMVATFVIASALMICDPSPLEPTAVATFVSALLASLGNVGLVGTYLQTSVAQPLVVQTIISVAFSVFIYTSDMRYVVFIRRVIVLLLLATTLGISIPVALHKSTAWRRHPVDELVYNNRIEADRWLRHATVSTTLKLAVAEYRDRHHGRDPPPKFDKWFDFAQTRKSVVIDRFDQIERDILPFWGLTPEQIRERIEIIKTQPNVGIIYINDGRAAHSRTTNDEHQEILDDIVALISPFVEQLPPMMIPINLQERPRVLVPWHDVHQLRLAATKPGFQIMSGRLGKRANPDASSPEDVEHAAPAAKDQAQPFISAKAFRQLEALACPPGSPTRAGVHWDVRDFCASCVVPHSKEQFLQDWQMSLDPCHQPDILNLHEFHTTPHRFDLYQDLLPLFSASKTSSFNDILIPFLRPGSKVNQDRKDFDHKEDRIMWGSDVEDLPVATHESVHGSHRLRLAYMAEHTTAKDTVPMLLGFGAEQNSRFRYEDTPIPEANDILPWNMSLTNPSEVCHDKNCALLRNNFRLEMPTPETDSRYVMLLDGSDGPAPGMLSVLHSHSVPVVSTIFQHWYTERLMPWVHFIPIDLRFHGLHSTMAYFLGLEGRGKLNGREQVTPPRTEDARWIAEQGRKWALKAIRKEDMEVYMFRLLLEWGRVIDDKRDSIGFVLSK
ncbi:hypothetical protein GGR57DRAFT_481778 [Xylariaceae sp. FL1272]|nr:hypothetical protein GGR57DRAFT_481778 [Xylariaceae sp. FL1272]